MDFSSLSLFQLMKTKLDYGSQRQGLLAQNVANADTPGYKAQDVVAPDFKKLAASYGAAQNLPHKLQMTTTNGSHLSGMTASSNSFKTEKRKNTDELNPNGNNVAIEDEMAKVADNQGEYEKTLNLYSAEVSMIKTAIDSTNSGG